MLFETLHISDAVRVRLDRKSDHRGFFARAFCAREFGAHGLPSAAVQASISFNARKGTVRGLHFQWPPSHEGKLVRCVRGKLWDVLLDLRPNSTTYLEHEALVLDEDNRDAAYIPPGVAHGFQTLADETEVFYQMTDYFAAELQTGLRWNDPPFGIPWPLPMTVISERDAAQADFVQATFEAELARRSRASSAAPVPT